VPEDFLLYGSNGYTGRLIVERALEVGLRPVLAGRNGAGIAAQAAAHGLEHRVFALDDPASVARGVEGFHAVLHAAGPFARTASPMVDACLRVGAHYLDITGEIEVFERIAARDAEARAAGVMLLPGAGFDVVPTDCLAAHLKRLLPSATRLRLAFHALGGGLSRGTATTMIENLGRGGAVRRDGRITRVPAAWRSRRVAFGFETRPVTVTTIPWGDVATAFHTTGIPDIEVYTRIPAGQRRLLKATRRFGWLLGSAAVQRALLRRVRAAPPGPSPDRRRRSVSLVWGEVEDDAGNRAVGRIRTPEGYTLTALTAVEAVRRVLAGDAPAGFRTPALAYGPDWILELDGVERVDGDAEGGGG
jgi:short subunit dehydrogenase-like uncharacterized protein